MLSCRQIPVREARKDAMLHLSVTPVCLAPRALLTGVFVIFLAVVAVVNPGTYPRLRVRVHNILPPTTAISDYAIGLIMENVQLS